MAKINFQNDQYYYVYNSGKRGTEIFKDTKDHTRFLFSLLHLNTDTSVGKEGNSRYLISPHYRGKVSVAGGGEKLVCICSYSLTPGSFHLILKQRKNKGVSRFMQKLGTGYAGYFNSKYNHKGRIFDGHFHLGRLR